jgi:hypothetical protein
MWIAAMGAKRATRALRHRRSKQVFYADTNDHSRAGASGS